MTISTTNAGDVTVLDSVYDYFRITNLQRQQEINRVVEELGQIENSFCAVFSFYSESFIFLSQSVQQALGYPLTDFTSHGFKFFFGITPPEFMPYIMHKQAGFIKDIQKQGFPYRKPYLIELDAALFHKNGKMILIHQEGVCLDYEPGGDFRCFFAVWIPSAGLSVKQLVKRKSELREKLRYVHRLIYAPGPAQVVGTKTNSLIELQIPSAKAPRLTAKEKELLILLAKGHSLKEVAKHMKVSYFTAESHRKSVFRKFSAKNVAELINKASKIYWLE